jgi:hypothetical protein
LFIAEISQSEQVTVSVAGIIMLARVSFYRERQQDPFAAHNKAEQEMSRRISRSFDTADRGKLSWNEKWKGPDAGLIQCWEQGRRMRDEFPDLVKQAERGELPPLRFKGAVDTALKNPPKQKYAPMFYLAQYQGLCGMDLDIDLDAELELVCKATGVVVVFTTDVEKYQNAA